MPACTRCTCAPGITAPVSHPSHSVTPPGGSQLARGSHKTPAEPPGGSWVKASKSISAARPGAAQLTPVASLNSGSEKEA